MGDSQSPAGGNTATPASDTGAVSVDGYGNRVTKLASGQSVTEEDYLRRSLFRSLWRGVFLVRY